MDEGAIVLSYVIEKKIEEGILRYFISGKRNPTASYQLWEAIYQDCKKFNTNIVYATVMLDGQIKPMEIPLLIRRLILLNDSRPIICAWVDHNLKSYFDNLLGERIPRPDSMNVKIFDCEILAEQWLIRKRNQQQENQRKNLSI